MMVPRRPRLGRHRLPLEAAANSGQIAVIAAKTTAVGATSLLQTARSAPEALMSVPLRHRAVVMRQHQCLQHHHRLGRHRLPLEVAANSGQTVAIAATTTPVGATSLLQIAEFAPELSMPVPLRHLADDAWECSVPVVPSVAT